MKGPAGKRICVRAIRSALVSGILIAGFLAGSPAASGSFQVNPVHVTIAANRSTASLTIRNTDAADVAVRMIAYRWTQENGEDVYSETTDIIASPPIFTVAPGATQLVRVGLKTRAAGGAYRVIVEEIPRDRPAGSQVQVALRLNLPLYLLPPKGAATDLTWRAWRDPSGELFVEASNSGALHAQILEIGASTAAGNQLVLSKEMGVVLPSGARRWKVGTRPDVPADAPLQLRIRSSAGDLREDVEVAQH